MQCAKCGSDNPAGKKFCGDCGGRLESSCPKCGADNPETNKFCGDCGAPLDSAAPSHAQPQPHEGLTGERRHLTVLFCDLVGSTGIAAQLDPEEWRETVAGYHRAAAEAITRFGGHVAKYLGDGVMAFFGYPEAHDNDAERAARAGLAIIDAIAKLNEQPERPKLAARVGIHSGAVVVGLGAGKEADVFGDAPNIAARVQEGAAPGTVLVTEDTHRLVSGLFVVEARGAPPLKGIERPIELYRVIQPSGVRGRLEAAAAARGLTPFVGREDELRLLMNRWERALDGEGQVALIIGEAGIGKSRLMQRFHEQIAAAPHTWIETAAAPFFQNTPFYPVAEMLKQALAWRGNEPVEEQLARLEPVLELAGLKPAEAVPLLAPLLNLPLPGRYPPSALSSEQQRRRLLATLVELALGLARVQPTVITTEDLHWVDPSTLELIQLLVEQGARARLLLLYTARPEFHAQWPLRAHHTQITLNRLNARNVRAMVGQVAAQRALSEETIAAMVERTGGVPLFIEELTLAVLQSGDAKLTGREIPVTLHDSLMARLDRLGPAKEVIQVGAVIGGEFTYELLSAVHPIADEDLQRGLRALADAELLYVRGIAPEATYLFKHALIRDAAYEALLKSRRKDLHRLVARTIDEQFTALKEAHPEVLARHWTEAGETEPAIAQWSRAGETARARNAFREALESYRQALALLNLLPESPARDLRELELRQSVVGMLDVTSGYSAPETTDATERAAALAEKSGNLPQLVTSVSSRCLISLFSGDLPAAGMLADQAPELALREGSPEGLAGVHTLQIMTRQSLGDLAGTEKHFKTGLKFFDDPRFRQDPRRGVLAAFTCASFNAWMLGRADVARERMAQMMAAVNRNNPYDLAFLGRSAAQLSVFMREYEQAEVSAAQALELSEKSQFPHMAALCSCFLGQAIAQLGRATEGVELIRQSIARLLQIGSRVGISGFTAGLAAAQEREGAIVDALATVEQALQANPDELVSRPEILTLRGELRVKQGQTELAESDFREAIALARTMVAKAFELRATMSLVRLLARHGRRDEARSMLAEIYGWFTEGFDTADLKDAKALLDELNA
jgi:class 3 adenylate cyclase/tetratricopeptide (TPR) repeat protein